jgi:hypothetical protein
VTELLAESSSSGYMTDTTLSRFKRIPPGMYCIPALCVRDARNSKGQLSHAGQLTFVLYLGTQLTLPRGPDRMLGSLSIISRTSAKSSIQEKTCRSA